MRCPKLDQLPSPPVGRTGWPWTVETPPLPETMPDGKPWPIITIVTPSFNQGQYIEETLRSVLLQGYPNLEYIVCDGGSTDETKEILERYRPFVSRLEIAPDRGQADALAKGFALGTGEVFAWLNSDDRYQPGALARVAAFFHRRPQLVFANGDVNFIDTESRFMKRSYAIRPNRFMTAQIGVHGWPQQGCFWRSEAYRQVGGVDPSLQFCMDRDLFIRLTAIGPSRRIPGSPLADFRMHPAAKSATIIDVAIAEGLSVTERYAQPGLRRFNPVFRTVWTLWCLPSRMRAGVVRFLGLEL